MSECVKNAGVVYGARGEIFHAKEGRSLEEFIKGTFGIDKVFEQKLVMGRCICHGKKDLQTDILLSNQLDTENFIFSKDCTKPHIVLIYDKPSIQTKSQPEAPRDVVIDAKQWGELVDSVKKLQLSLDAQQNSTPATSVALPTPVPTGVVHREAICDGCYPEENNTVAVKPIVGTRFKCLQCADFDLCSSCEAKDVELNSHRRHHNMIKINTPLQNGVDLDSTSLRSTALNDREVIVDIPEHEREIFEMFSSVDAVREVIRGYKAYCARQTNSKPEFASLEITITRRDDLLTFNVYNNARRALPGGCTLALSGGDSVFDLYLGSHSLRPGCRKLFHKHVSHELTNDFAPRIDILYGSEKRKVLFTGFGSCLLDIRIGLTPPTNSPTALKRPAVTPDQSDCKPLSSIIKEDEGVISSSMENDEYSLCSDSDSASNWDDYDFLSEDDV